MLYNNRFNLFFYFFFLLELAVNPSEAARRAKTIPTRKARPSPLRGPDALFVPASGKGEVKLAKKF
jgi:hypothetical protein